MAMALPLPSKRVHRQSGPERPETDHHNTFIICNFPQFHQALCDLTPEKLIVVLHPYNSNYLIISSRNGAYLFDLEYSYFTKDTFNELVQFIDDPCRVKICQFVLRLNGFKVKAKNSFSLKLVFNKLFQQNKWRKWKKKKVDIYSICQYYNFNFKTCKLYVDLKSRPYDRNLVSKYVSDQIRMYFFAFQKLCQEFNVNYTKTVVNNSLGIDVNIKELIDKNLLRKSTYYDNDEETVQTGFQIPIKYCTTSVEFQEAELELRAVDQISIDSKSFNSQLEILIIGTIDKMFIFRLTGLYSANIPQHFIVLKHILQNENVFKLIYSQDEIQALFNILSITNLENCMDISSSILSSDGEAFKAQFQEIERINRENMIMWGLRDEDIQAAAIKIAFQMISNIHVFIGPTYEDISADDNDSDESIENSPQPQTGSSKVIIATSSTNSLQIDKDIDSSVQVQENEDYNHVTIIVENTFKSICEALDDLEKHLFVALLFPNDSNYIVISSLSKAYFFDLISISAHALTKVVQFIVDPSRIKISFDSIQIECCEVQNVFELSTIYNTRIGIGIGENKYQQQQVMMNQIKSLSKLCEAYGYNFDNNCKQNQTLDIDVNVNLNSRPLNENSVRNFISREMLMYFYLFEKYCQEFFIKCNKRMVKNCTHFDVDLRGLFSCQLLTNPNPSPQILKDCENSLASLPNSNKHTDNSSNGSIQVLNHVEIQDQGQGKGQLKDQSQGEVKEKRIRVRKRSNRSIVSKLSDKVQGDIIDSLTSVVLPRPVRILFCSTRKEFTKAAHELDGVPYICMDAKAYCHKLKLVVIGTWNRLYIFPVSTSSPKSYSEILGSIVSRLSSEKIKIIVYNMKNKITIQDLLLTIKIQLCNVFDIGSSKLCLDSERVKRDIQKLDKKYPLDHITWSLRELRRKSELLQRVAVQTTCHLLENIELFVPPTLVPIVTTTVCNEIKLNCNSNGTPEVNGSSSLSFGSCSSSMVDVELNNCIVEYVNTEESCQNQNQSGAANLVEFEVKIDVEKQSLGPSKFYRKGININAELMENLDTTTSLPVNLISTSDDFENAKSILDKTQILSLDCKLFNGRVCLIVIGSYSNIFLFDTNSLAKSSIQVLKSILENDRIIKLMYKCEQQYTCLLEKFQIKLNTILDIELCNYDSFSRGFSIRELIEDFANMSETKWNKRPINEDLKSSAAEISSLLFLNHIHFYLEVDEDLNEIDSQIKNLNLIDLEEENGDCLQEFNVSSSIIPLKDFDSECRPRPNTFFKYSREELLEIGLKFELLNPSHESIVKNLGLYRIQKHKQIVNRGVTETESQCHAETKITKKKLDAFLRRFSDKIPDHEVNVEIPELDFVSQQLQVSDSDASIMNDIKFINENLGGSKEGGLDSKVKGSIKRLLLWSVNELEEKSKSKTAGAGVSNSNQKNNAASIGKVEQSSQTGLTGEVYCQNIHIS